LLLDDEEPVDSAMNGRDQLSFNGNGPSYGANSDTAETFQQTGAVNGITPAVCRDTPS